MPMNRETKQAVRERIWFLEHEAKTMRDEAKRLRASLKAPTPVKQRESEDA